jgi:hypothetical protein
MQEAHDLGYGVYRVSVKAAQVALQAGKFKLLNTCALRYVLLYSSCRMSVQLCQCNKLHS